MAVTADEHNLNWETTAAAPSGGVAPGPYFPPARNQSSRVHRRRRRRRRPKKPNRPAKFKRIIRSDLYTLCTDDDVRSFVCRRRAHDARNVLARSSCTRAPRIPPRPVSTDVLKLCVSRPAVRFVLFDDPVHDTLTRTLQLYARSRNGPSLWDMGIVETRCLELLKHNNYSQHKNPHLHGRPTRIYES